MSARTVWTVRIATMLAFVAISYLLLTTIGSRSPWVVLAVAGAGIPVGEVLRRVTATRRRGQESQSATPE